ncbi:MAG: hypothetical protein VZS44_06645 [Bacilli bacterium]|nr:hypothetical protein [Bacilli bacterium]
MDNINELVIDGNEIFDFISYLDEFREVKDIEFRNCEFSKDEIIFLANKEEYNRIGFINCSFEDEKLIQKIKTKSLSLSDNKIIDYEFVYDMVFLENLTIVGGKVDVLKLNFLKKLEYLRISHSHVDKIEMIELYNLKYLFIDNTNIKDLSFIKRIPKLELLSISDDQKSYNKDLIKEISKYIKIIGDSIIEMEVIQDE